MANRARYLEHQPAARRSIGRTQRLVVLGAVLALGSSFAAVAGSPFDDICPGATGRAGLCEAVGKRAVTRPSSIHMPRLDLGTIIGVTWLAAGTVVGAPEQVRGLELTLPEGYYFLVEIEGVDGAPLLRPVSRIEPR